MALLHAPNARMKAGGMPAVDASPEEMTALLAYLKTLGDGPANSSASLSIPNSLLAKGHLD